VRVGASRDVTLTGTLDGTDSPHRSDGEAVSATGEYGAGTPAPTPTARNTSAPALRTDPPATSGGPVPRVRVVGSVVARPTARWFRAVRR
jgi:hypothetical protein